MLIYVMAANLVIFMIYLILAVDDIEAAAEFGILHSPPCLKFSESSKTLESLLKEIISASLGLSVDENSEWRGLYILDPFTTPEAAVSVYIDGVSSLGNHSGFNITTFPLTVDEYSPKVYEAVKHRIKQRFRNGGNKLINVQLSNRQDLTSRPFVDVFGALKIARMAKQPLVSLKYTTNEDYKFLNELQVLKAITEKVASGAIVPDNIVDFYNFRFTSLHALSDFHGPNSAEIEEAKTLLSNALQELSKAFIKAYYGSVLVTTTVTDVTHSHRIVRSPDDDDAGAQPEDTPPAVEDQPAGPEVPPGLLPPDLPGPPVEDTTNKPILPGQGGANQQFDTNFTVMFNIFLWMGLIYWFALMAIVYAMMDMDPGRDSIIYRMTSTRMKKDL